MANFLGNWRLTRLGASLLALMILWSGPALGQSVILPPGTVLQVLPADQVNQELIDAGRATPTTLPFTSGTQVWEVQTSAEDHFVRFYVYDPARLKGGAVGGWLMRANEGSGGSRRRRSGTPSPCPPSPIP